MRVSLPLTAASNSASRLLHFSMPEPNSGCWLWLACVDGYGYGWLRHREPERTARNVMAHRLSWATWRQPLLAGQDVLHRCDLPACINPDHLFIGDHDANMRDMASKGRAVSGCYKLSLEQVLAIAVDTRTHEAIAQDYGVCATHVGRIIRGETWRKHLNSEGRVQ